jgi:hypothetical protein
VTYSFHPEAEAEFVQAIDYYEACEAGLGYDFAIEVCAAIERTVAHPKAWPIIEEDMRRSLVRRFPFGIIYAEIDNELVIVAVMHLHRDPDCWTHRVQ